MLSYLKIIATKNLYGTFDIIPFGDSRSRIYSTTVYHHDKCNQSNHWGLWRYHCFLLGQMLQMRWKCFLAIFFCLKCIITVLWLFSWDKKMAKKHSHLICSIWPIVFDDLFYWTSQWWYSNHCLSSKIFKYFTQTQVCIFFMRRKLS